MNNLQAVILCGGLSTRFGTPKAHIQLPDGSFLLDRLIAKVRVFAPVALSCNEHQSTADVLARFACPLVVDHKKEIGPMGGLLSAYQAYPQHDILLLGCDMPNLGEDMIATLMEHFLRKSSIPAVGKSDRLEPLLAIYPRNFYQQILEAVNQKAYGLQKLLSKHSYQPVAFTTAQTVNINTPAAWNRFILKP